MHAGGPNSEPSIVNYGLSEQLKSDFDLLREVNDKNGIPKFTSKSVDSLAQHLVCRHYSKLCYELSHLLWSIIFLQSKGHSNASIQQALLNYFWIRQCHSSSTFRTYFEDALSTTVEQNLAAISLTLCGSCKATNQIDSGSDSAQSSSPGISLNIYDHSFKIHASRANILACFMEWLVCVIPDILHGAEETLLGKGHNAISEFSSHLQKQIYAYLGDKLPPAKLQMRYRMMQSFFQAQSSDGNSIVNDGSILQFWLSHNEQEGYTKFSSVLKDCLSYQQALAITDTSLHQRYAQSDTDLGSDNDIAFAQNLFEASSSYANEHSIDIKSLSQAPKALNKQASELIELAATYPKFMVPLSLTWLRFQSFANVQHKLIQRSRTQQYSNIATDKFNALFEQDYLQIYKASIGLLAGNQQTLLAIVHILLPRAPAQACLILLKLMPSLPKYKMYFEDFSALLDGKDCLSLEFGQASLAQWQLSYPWFKELINQSQLAYKKINREGFTAKSVLEEHEYTRCAEHLFDLNKLIKQLLSAIKQNSQQSVANYRADRFIFSNEFTRLYLQDAN